jgi:hypothetical protein
MGFGLEIKLIVNSGSRQIIFGNEVLTKKTEKKLKRNLKGSSIKRLGCDDEGLLTEDLGIQAGINFGQIRRCGYNEVIELTKYVQTYMNYEIIYVNCSSSFISERIPMGQSELTWSDALDTAEKMKQNKNIDYVFLVHIDGKYKSDLPDLSLELGSDSKVYAICDGCEGDGKYHWTIDEGRVRKTTNDYLSLPSGYQKLECYWQNEYGDCQSNIIEIAEERKILNKICNLKNNDPAINADNKYYSRDSESIIIHETNQTNYYFLIDSICDVDWIVLSLNDFKGRLVREVKISTSDLAKEHTDRMNSKQPKSISEKEIIDEFPRQFLIVLSEEFFKRRFHEIFQLKVEYIIDSGNRIEVESTKVRFTSCSE